MNWHKRTWRDSHGGIASLLLMAWLAGCTTAPTVPAFDAEQALPLSLGRCSR
jgi:hypothetical protein